MGLPFFPQPKPNHPRKQGKRAHRAAFDAKTRKRIIERDGGLCVRCGARYEEIHHICFRSAGGLGTVDNGVCVCGQCHRYAHQSRFERLWFENYREKRLLNHESTNRR